MGIIKMEDILSANIGESQGTLSAKFKKTVNIRQYESETVEANAELILDYPLSSPERALVTTILMAQVEYAVICQLYYKNQMAEGDFVERRSQIEKEVQAMANKAEKLLGRSVDNLIKATGEAQVQTQVQTQAQLEAAGAQAVPDAPTTPPVVETISGIPGAPSPLT